MNDPDFYPEKSEKEKDAVAWAIAWSKHNKSKKKKAFNLQEYRIAQKADK
jgi:hypothetical protein